MLREEKPEAFASPEQNPEDGSSKKKKKRCKWRKRKNKINENRNPQPQVCSEPLVVVTPISELKSNEESVTLPDSNNIPTKEKRKKNRNKKKSMINGEEPKPALELEKNEEPKPALELGNKIEVEPMTRKRKRKSVQNGAESNEHNIEQAETVVPMSIVDREVPPIDKAIAVNNQPVSLDEPEERYFERKKTNKEKKKEYMERKKLLGGEFKSKGEKRKNKINENRNPQPQVCSEPLVVVTPISELKSNEESVTLPDSNNIPMKKKRKKNRNKKKSMINGEEPKPALELEKNEEPKPALELGNKIEVEPMTRKRKRKSVQNGAESNEHNIEQAETVVPMSIVDREVPPIDKAIAVNNQPVSLDEPEERYFERKKTNKEKKEYMERKKLLGGEFKSKGGKKTKNDTLETLAPRPFDPITEPTTDPAVVMDTHPATPIVAEQKTAKKRHKKKKRKREAGQYSIAETSVQGTKGVTVADAPNDQHGQSSMVRNTIHGFAETSVQGTKGVTVADAPNDQHGQSSMLCWACRETNHTIQQCRKLKSLSKDEEVCFFCLEIGHSLGKCSVYIAGGGRLARCLFCNAHGHFSYNCSGNCHDPKGLPVEAENMVQC